MGDQTGDVLEAEAPPSLLSLDSNSILHICHFLASPRDLASLQQCCKALYDLLQDSSSWAHVLSLNYGLQLRATSAPAAATGSAAAPERGAEASEPGPEVILPHCKGLTQLLASPASDLHPVRFGALITDGGVDGDSLHYWADHLFIPNAWAPYCAKNANNVNVLAVLKTGPAATAELRHRSLLVGCLQHVLPRLQHPAALQLGPDGQVPPLAPAAVAGAAAQLRSWGTLALESFFVEAAARLAGNHPMGLGLLAGLPGPRDEARQAVLALGAGFQLRNWYERTYRLAFLPPPGQHPHRDQQELGAAAAAVPVAAAAAASSSAAQAGGGWRGGVAAAAATAAAAAAVEYVVDERAVQEDLMGGQAGEAVALLHGISVSRAGRVSCPVQCGAVLAGLLPPGWHTHTHAGADQHPPGGQAPAPAPASVCSALVASLGQGAVAELDGVEDAATVLSACASGCLPPWVRHVVCPHGQWVEFLPRHLWAYARGGAGTEAAAAAAEGREAVDDAAPLLPVQPVVWFRFTDVAEYHRRRPTAHAVSLLRNLCELLGGAAELLAGTPLASCASVPEFSSDSNSDSDLDGYGGPYRDPHAHACRGLGLSRLLEAARDTADSLAAGGGAGGASGAAAGPGAAGGGGAGGGRDAADATSCTAGAGEDATRAAAESLAAAAAAGGGGSALSALLARVQAAGRLAQRLMALLSAAAMLAPNVAAASGFALPEAVLPAALEHCGQLHAALADLSGLVSELEEGYYDEEFGEEVAAEPPPAAAAAQPRRSAPHGGGEQRGNEPTAAAAASRNKWREEWLLDAGVELQRALRRHAAALGPEGDAERRGLAAALRREAAAALAAQVGADLPALREMRNEELLRRLPVELPPPVMMTPAAATAAAAPAAAEPAGAPGGGDTGAQPPAVDGACGFVRPLPGPHATLEPPPPEGWAAERLFDPALQDDVDEGRCQLPDHNHHDQEAHRVVHLAAPLLFPVAAQAVVFKAIRPENLMDQVGWDHHEHPNVDVQYVGLQGRVLRLPPGVQPVAAAE